MCAAKVTTGEPYRLYGERMAFIDWRYVRPCNFSWVNSNGNVVSVLGEEDEHSAQIKHFFRPWGIGLKVFVPDYKTGPVFTVERPWEEGGINILTVIKEEGIYRAWGSTGWGDLSSRGSTFFCYFESTDGMNWKRPSLHLVEAYGSRDNNIMDTRGGTVFVDPSAPVQERYKWISESHFSRKEYEEYVLERPGELDPRSNRKDAGIFVGVRGAVSPDGLRWNVLEKPLVMMHSDTQIVAYYDSLIGRYVGYFRDFMVGPRFSLPDAVHLDGSGPPPWLFVGRRAVGRAETDDFRRFPLSEVVLEPDPCGPPSNVLYTNCRTNIPGSPESHLMFPAVWDMASDSTYIELASSHEGKVWNRLTQTPLFQTGVFGEWDGGCLFALPNLIELSNGDFALPYTGYNVPHKYPRRMAKRNMGYAVWNKGRLAGIEAKEKGEFATVAVVPPGKHAYINAVTKRTGNIMVEALDMNYNVMAGRSFEECVSIVGDCFNQPITWKQHDHLGIKRDEAVILKFKLDQACLFSIDFRD